MEQYKVELEKSLELILAGNCTITFKNELNQKRFTYKIKKFKRNENLFFVHVLSGCNNEKDYSYLGRIIVKNLEQKQIEFDSSKGSKISTDALSFKGFKYLIEATTIHHKMNENMCIYHEGKCARCGRKLTDPDSIIRGIGPECWTKI